MKKTLLFCFALTAIFYSCYMHYTGNFSINSIQYDWRPSNQWQLAFTTPNESEKTVFDQTFSFYDQGNQSYVFLSEDNKYVLKFFKFWHLKPSKWWDMLPSLPVFQHYKSEKKRAQTNRLVRLYQGHFVAETYNKKNTGIILTHLHSTANQLNKKIKVKGPWGVGYTIDLDDTPFILQEKAIPTRNMFNKFFKENNLPKIYSLIDELFNLYLREYKLGVYDRDCNMIDNTGFIGEKALRIDVGKLKFDNNFSDSQRYLKDLEEKLIKRLKTWVKRHYPFHSKSINFYVETKMNTLQSLLENNA